MITAQFAKGNGGIYRYYRCSKKKGICSQSYLQEKDLVNQLQERLQTISLCDKYADYMLVEIDKMENTENESSQSDIQNLTVKIKESEARMEKLVSVYLDNDIPKEIYLKKKDESMRATLTLKDKKKDLEHNGNNWVESLREWIKDTKQADILSSSMDLQAIRSFVQKIGTNHSALDKTAKFAVPLPFGFVAQRRRFLPLCAPSARRVSVLTSQEVQCCAQDWS